MSTKLIIVTGVLALTSSASFVLAQIESTLPRKSAQPREAIQPSVSTAPALKPKTPLDKPPRLTDGATDERGNELEARDDSTGPTEVLTNRPSTTTLRSRNPDLVMATWIALANHEEIALAELAADRAENVAVRQFAANMVKEHETFINRLRPFAPEAIRRDYLNTTARDARTEEAVIRNRAAANNPAIIAETPAPSKSAPSQKPARVGPVIDVLADGKPPEPDLTPSVTRTEETRPRLETERPEVVRVAAKPILPVGRDFNVVQVERELAVQGLASTKEMLLAKTGVDFDEWFLAHQIGMHKAMRDKLIVYQRYVSSDLGKVFAAGEAASVDHLTLAKELLDQVSGHVVAEPAAKK